MAQSLAVDLEKDGEKEQIQKMSTWQVGTCIDLLRNNLKY